MNTSGTTTGADLSATWPRHVGVVWRVRLVPCGCGSCVLPGGYQP